MNTPHASAASTQATGLNSHTVRVDDIDVAYTEAGSGQPVVMLHGLAEDRSTWSTQQRAITECHTYAYDLRGHGDTTLGTPEGTLAQLGRDLISFLEEVTGPAEVVGFSLGGTIALWAAAERPDLVPHAVVLGTSSVVGRGAMSFYDDRMAKAADTSSTAFRDALREDTVNALALAARATSNSAADTPETPAPTTAVDHLIDTVVADRLKAVGDGAGYLNAARAMAGLHADPLTPRLAAIGVPVDVVGATEDAFCPARAASIILDALSDATYHEIPDAGHLMNIDRPDAVTAVLRDTITGRN